MENKEVGGFNIVEFGDLDSTNTKARELAGKGAGAWTVVTALRQDQGRGRKGNEWYSPPGGLYFSVILPKSNIDDLQILTIMAAFAVAQAVKDGFGVEPFIKLPNDVYLDGKKICGIMTENVIAGDIKCSVMGIGFNTNIIEFPGELSGSATSLRAVLGKPIDNNAILEQIITQLQKILASISR